MPSSFVSSFALHVLEAIYKKNFVELLILFFHFNDSIEAFQATILENGVLPLVCLPNRLPPFPFFYTASILATCLFLTYCFPWLIDLSLCFSRKYQFVL